MDVVVLGAVVAVDVVGASVTTVVVEGGWETDVVVC
jgi:hypothetical protein